MARKSGPVISEFRPRACVRSRVSTHKQAEVRTSRQATKRTFNPSPRPPKPTPSDLESLVTASARPVAQGSGAGDSFFLQPSPSISGNHQSRERRSPFMYTVVSEFEVVARDTAIAETLESSLISS